MCYSRDVSKEGKMAANPENSAEVVANVAVVGVTSGDLHGGSHGALDSCLNKHNAKLYPRALQWAP